MKHFIIWILINYNNFKISFCDSIKIIHKKLYYSKNWKIKLFVKSFFCEFLSKIKKFFL